MAAGTHWKRPWEEDADGSSDHSASVVPPPSVRSSVSSQYPATLEPQHGALKAQLPSLFRDSESFKSTNANQPTSLGARDNNQQEGQPRYRQASMTAPQKRQRTSVSALDLSSSPAVLYQLKGMVSVTCVKSNSIAAHFYYPGSLDGQDGRHRLHGAYSTHDWNGLRDHSQDTGAMNSHELGNHFPADTVVIPDLQGKCRTCRSLQSLVPQAASVVEELYEDMSIALKDRIPDWHEVKTNEHQYHF